MKILRKRPGEKPEIIEIENTLKALQREVEGYIEAVTIAKDMAIICNEEGRLLGLEPNCEYDGLDFVGTILVVGVNGEEFCDVPERTNVRL